MILKVLPLKSRSRSGVYDAVLFVNDKALTDEIDKTWERMLAGGSNSIKEDFGLVRLLITPRTKSGRNLD